MSARLLRATLIAIWLIPALGLASDEPTDPAQEVHTLCSELINAIEMTATDPNLTMLLRVLNERLRRLENPPGHSTPLSHVLKTIDLATLKTEILTGRLAYGDEVKGRMIRDTTGANLRLRWLLESFGSKSKASVGRGSVPLQVATGSLIWIVKAEREKVFSAAQLKNYIAAANLRRKRFDAKLQTVRIPEGLDAEVSALLERMEMHTPGSFQVFYIGALHLICDAFNIPDAVPDDNTPTDESPSLEPTEK